jgi:hypothetical protein
MKINLNIHDTNLGCQIAPGFNGVKHCAKNVFFNNKIWLLIPKNGCSTIAFCVALQKGVINASMLTKNDWPYLAQKAITNPNILTVDFNEPRIAFYRDPVERFCSMVNWVYEHRSSGPFKAFYESIVAPKTKQEMIKRFIIYASINNMFKNVERSDQHFVSQYRYIEYIKGFKNLELYDIKDIKTIFNREGIEYHHINKSTNKIITVNDIKNNDLEEIKYIYRDDYKLLDLISHA